MPSYEYRCADCGRTQVLFRPSEVRHAPAECDCGGQLGKIISRANITMNHWAYGDAPVGLSQLDKLNEYREETKLYEKQNGKGADVLDKGKSMDQILAGGVG